jgi:serine/threonine-protein kinase
VLFELVGGKTPFTGDSADDLLKKHLTAPVPSVQIFNKNVTDDFAALIRRMMSKRKDDRPRSMWEFQKEFRSTPVFKVIPRSPEQRRLRIEDYEKEATLVKREKYE